MREKSLLGPPPFDKEPTWPVTPTVTDDITAYSPEFRTPYTMSWSFGIQRELNKDTALEVRYMGNKSLQGLTSYDYNNFNIIENGMLDEFWLAQKNLYANINAGRGTNFRYYGPGTGTYPLPIVLAHLGGTLDPNDAANYQNSKLGSTQGGFFTNSSRVANLNQYNPAAGTFASNLEGDAVRRANALAAGLPANFFMVNPAVRGGATIYQNGGWNKYDGMTVEVRRRMSKGLMVNANFTWAKSFSSSMLSFRRARVTNLGGTLPAVIERMDHTVKARGLEMPLPSQGVRRVYVDCSSLGPRTLELAVAVYGADRIVLGTDCPIFRSDWTLDAIREARLTDAQREAILSGNAARLLERFAPAPLAATE